MCDRFIYLLSNINADKALVGLVSRKEERIASSTPARSSNSEKLYGKSPPTSVTSERQTSTPSSIALSKNSSVSSLQLQLPVASGGTSDTAAISRSASIRSSPKQDSNNSFVARKPVSKFDPTSTYAHAKVPLPAKRIEGGLF